MNNIHEKIIVYQSYKFYNKFYSLICRWCDIDDIIQYCYESILKRKLWECDNKRILTTVINRSCVEFLRKNVVGFRQYDIKFDNTSVSIDDLLFIDNNNDDEDNINIKISISQLSKFLTDKQKYILWLFINGYTNEEISKKIKVTASRISQIIIIIENKLYEIVNYNKIPDKLYTGDFCKFHPNKKVFNRKRGICQNCCVKLSRLNLLHTDESVYSNYLSRKLSHGESNSIIKEYKDEENV